MSSLHRIALALLVVLLPSAVEAQASRLRVTTAEENFRAVPKGARIAVLAKDALLRGGETQGDWTQATLEGWIPAEKLKTTKRDGFTLSAARTVPLRATPEGAAIARALEGILLDEVERRDGWVRVRRTGWVWRKSLADEPTAAGGTRTVAPADTAAPKAVPVLQPLVVLAKPGGDTLSVLPGDARVEVVGKEGAWTRVRIEGWTLQNPIGAETADQGASVAALRQDPERFRGRKVEWTAQFVSLQRADSLRRDFARGEVYLLAREPNGEPGFVYIVVPAAQLTAAKGLQPLQRFRFVARVRQGRSPQMGHPVLELVELRP